MGLIDRSVAEYAIADSTASALIVQSIAYTSSGATVESTSGIQAISKTLTKNNSEGVLEDIDIQITNQSQTSDKCYITIKLRSISKMLTESTNQISTENKLNASNINILANRGEQTVDLDLSAEQRATIAEAVVEKYSWQIFDKIPEDQNESVIEEEFND